MSFVERYENLYIFVQQKSRSTSGFSCIGAILDCYGAFLFYRTVTGVVGIL